MITQDSTITWSFVLAWVRFFYRIVRRLSEPLYTIVLEKIIFIEANMDRSMVVVYIFK